MAVPRIRRNPSTSFSLQSWILYAAAVVFGIAIGRYSASEEDVNEWTLLSSQNGPHTPKVLEHNGFHPIYVYRGNPSPQKDSNIDQLLDHPPPPELFTRNDYEQGSQVNQDVIISALVSTYQTKYDTTKHQADGSSRSPYFLDLAANDAIYLSNTLRLESQGWNGLCIEPNGFYWYRLAHRKCTVAAAFIGGKQDGQEIQVRLGTGEYGGIVGKGFDNPKKKPTDETRFSVSFQTLLEQFEVPHVIDYLSLDVEGAEEIIMKDFPFQEYTFRFLTVERPHPSLQALFRANGYQFVMLLVHWGETLWVHETVLQSGFTLDEIQNVAHSKSKYTKQKPNPGANVFNLETGKSEKFASR